MISRTLLKSLQSTYSAQKEDEFLLQHKEYELTSDLRDQHTEPHFRFYCSVWGFYGVTKLQTLQKLQNRAVRIVTKSSFDTPWPTVSDIIKSETATTMYKSLNGLVPEYVSSLFEKRLTQNARELRNTETDLSIPLLESNKEQECLFALAGLSLLQFVFRISIER